MAFLFYRYDETISPTDVQMDGSRPMDLLKIIDNATNFGISFDVVTPVDRDFTLDFTAAPANHDVLRFNSASGNWEPVASSVGFVTSFNGRTGAVVPETNDYTWAQLDKTVSSIGDITTKNASDVDYDNVSSGLLATDVQAAIDEVAGISEKAIVTVGTSGADYNNFDAAIDYLRPLNGGTIAVITNMTLSCSADRDVSNIRFVGIRAGAFRPTISPGTISGKWHGTNISFESLTVNWITSSTHLLEVRTAGDRIFVQDGVIIGMSTKEFIDAKSIEGFIFVEAGTIGYPSPPYPAVKNGSKLLVRLLNQGFFVAGTGGVDKVTYDSSSTFIGTFATEERIDNSTKVIYDPTISGLAATDVKAALDEIDGDLDTHISDTLSVHGIADTSDLALKSGDLTQFLGHSHTSLDDIGTNTHADLDTFINQLLTVTKVLHVDGNRVDAYTADGSLARPFKTIAAAAAVATTSSVIKAVQGTYVEDVVLPAGVSLEGYSSNRCVISGDVTVSAGEQTSLRYITFSGTGKTLTINASCSILDCYSHNAVVIAGSATTQAYNFHIAPASGVTPLTVTSTGKAQFFCSTIASTGDAPAISQSAGQVIINTGNVTGARAAAPIINSTGGNVVLLASQVINSHGGPAIDVSANGALVSNPNLLGDVLCVGNAVCGTRHTVVEGLQFISVGSLSGSNLILRKASLVANDSSVTGVTVKDALDTLDAKAETDPLSLHLDGSKQMTGDITWATDGAGDIGSADGGATLLRPNKAWVKEDLGVGNKIVVGPQAGELTTKGDKSICLGWNAGLNLSTGRHNVCLGSITGSSLTTQGHNIFIGEAVGNRCNTEFNTAVGGLAFRDRINGGGNTAIGTHALQAFPYDVPLGIGFHNTGVGYQTLRVVTGSRNIAIGAFAGRYGTGDDKFYLNSRDRTNAAGDQTKSLLYGGFAVAEADQFLTVNAGTITLGTSTSTTHITDKAGVGVASPKAKLDVAGGVKIADDSDVASVDKVGTLRYRSDANNSYVDMVMQTGAATYAWVNIVQNSW